MNLLIKKGFLQRTSRGRIALDKAIDYIKIIERGNMFFGTVERPPRLSEFEFEIPENLVAQNPPKTRDACKLMVVNKENGDIQHKKFSDITDLFNKGDVLVLNNTKVFPARLYATKDKSDAKVEVFLLRELENDLWEAMVKPARKVRIGNKLIFNKNIS